MKTRLRILWLALAAALLPTAAQADFYLIVHEANPLRALTQKEAIDLFMGRNRTFAHGDWAQVFDLPRDAPRRAAFYEALTGLSAAQVNSYWARLMFSGQSPPPQMLVDEAAMVRTVRRNTNALGWLSREPADPALRTVLVIKAPAS